MPVNTAVVSLNADSAEVPLFSDDYPSACFDIQAAAVSPDTPKLLFSRKEAAYSLGLSLRSISILLKNGQLGFRKCGAKVLIPQQELVKFSRKDHDLT
jgi:excisionase family DNA binding protein